MRRDPSRWWYLVVVGVACAPVAPLLYRFVTTMAGLAAAGGGPAGALRTAGATGTIRAMWAAAAAVGLCAGPGLAAGLYLDARAVGARTSWTPAARRWGLGGLCYPLSVAVALGYLVRRYRRVGLLGVPVERPPTRAELADSGLWRGVAAGTVGVPAVGGAWVAATLRVAGGRVGLLTVGVVLGLLVVGLLYVAYAAALLADAERVRASDVGWTPRIRVYRFLLAAAPLPGLLAGVVYLYGRHRHVGAP
ncbi:MAG: hypothetical protein ABEH40_03890 [Haloferacaceae archaeon]